MPFRLGVGGGGGRGAAPVDLYIFLHMARHKVFEREGTTLFTRAPLSFTTAALGGEIGIPGLDGRKHDIAIPAGIQSGKQLRQRSEEHTSELQSLMRISYAVFCLKKKNYLPKYT